MKRILFASAFAFYLKILACFALLDSQQYFYQRVLAQEDETKPLHQQKSLDLFPGHQEAHAQIGNLQALLLICLVLQKKTFDQELEASYQKTQYYNDQNYQKRRILSTFRSISRKLKCFFIHLIF